MSTTDNTNAARRGSGSNDLLGQASEARWYCLDRDGVAMLCKDEADARAQVVENDDLWPARAPHRAALLCDLEYLRDGGDFIPLAQPRNEQAKQTAELCLSAWATARMDALEAKNAALAREAHTWWTAARDAIKLREPLAPEVIEAAAAEAFGYEGGLQEVNLGDLLHFARVLEQRHGIGA